MTYRTNSAMIIALALSLFGSGSSVAAASTPQSALSAVTAAPIPTPVATLSDISCTPGGTCVYSGATPVPATGVVTSPFGNAQAKGFLNGLETSIESVTQRWFTGAQSVAEDLFYGLLLIEIAYTMIVWMLERRDLAKFFGDLVVKILAIGFFYTIILQASYWIPHVVGLFPAVAVKAIGASGQVDAHGIPIITPGDTFITGWKVAGNIIAGATKNLGGLQLLSPVSWLTAGLALLAAIGLALAYMAAAASLLLTMIEFSLLSSIGIIFLGLAGSRWTINFAEKYISYLVNVGIKLMMFYVVVYGLGTQFTNAWLSKLQGQIGLFNLQTYVLLIMYSGLFFFVVMQVRGFASAISTGIPHASLAPALAMATGAASAAAAVGASAVTAGASLGVGGAAMVAARVAGEKGAMNLAMHGIGAATNRDLHGGGNGSYGASALQAAARAATGGGGGAQQGGTSPGYVPPEKLRQAAALGDVVKGAAHAAQRNVEGAGGHVQAAGQEARHAGGAQVGMSHGHK